MDPFEMAGLAIGLYLLLVAIPLMSRKREQGSAAGIDTGENRKNKEIVTVLVLPVLMIVLLFALFIALWFLFPGET